MTVRISKPEFNLREKLTELDKPSGLKGNEILRSETSQEVRDLIGAGRKNLIINGAMSIAQRATSSTDGGGYNTIDRIDYRVSGADENPTQSQVDVASGTTPYTLGFRKAFRFTNGNQTGGANAGDYLFLFYQVEGQDIVQSGWDYKSGASFITLSFWVKSSVAQNFYGYIRSRENTEQSHSYETGTLLANTWTKVTKTFSGNSNIVMDNDTGQGLGIYLAPFFGTDSTDNSKGTTAWSAYSQSTRTPDNNSTWWTTNDATFEITGLQLEVGNIATEFEHRSFGEELALCQRYCQAYGSKNPGDIGGRIAHGTWSNGTQARATIHLPVQMRAIPSIHSYTAGHVLREAINWYGVSGVGISESTKTHCTFIYSFSSSSGASANEFATWGNGAGVVIEAEL